MRVGLAHRRLSIIDLSDAGAQPMLDPLSGNCIVFNGEIYNYQALRSELISRGHAFRSHSDTEVLLKLYAEFGRSMLARLRGMFSFALWDAAARSLFLARDPFGIKPLYLADDGRTLRFASQVKALRAGGAKDLGPEPAGHAGFFLWGHVPEPFTLFKGIRALPAGASMWLETGGAIDVRQYCSLASEILTGSVSKRSAQPAAAAEHLKAALLDSVRSHLIADVPVGVFLSAGLDSATVAALAKEAGTDELRTCTLGFREFAGTVNDEVPPAEIVARAYDASHTTRWVQREDFLSHFDHLLEVMDQPSIDGVNSYFVSLAAREAGLKVALSGLGGDEIFGGYSDFRDIPRLVRLTSRIAAVPRIGRWFQRSVTPVISGRTSPKWAGILEYGGTYAGAYLLRRGLFMPWELDSVLDGDMAKQGWEDLHTLPALQKSISGVKDPRSIVTLLETTWYMRNQLLRDTDWASMAHSLEVRVPLVDIELFRAVAGLVRSGWTPGKQDLARTPSRKLPSAVMNRRKTGFGVPVREWLMASRSETTHKSERGLRAWARFLYSSADTA